MKKQVRFIFSHQSLLLLGLVGVVPAARAQSSFGNPTLYAVGSTSPLGLALGDVNGDGRLDIVTANQDGNNVSVLLGQATPVGSFAPASTYTTGPNTRPTGIALGDVNGDGRLDIVTGNQQAGTVGVLLGLPAAPGSFAAPTVYSSGGSTPNILALGDLNGDGRLDIAVGNTGAGNVGVLLNSPTTPGTFPQTLTYASGGINTVGIAIGDLNADGRPDIVTGNQTGLVGVLLATAAGPGAFAPAITYASGGTGTVGVTLGDADGDGRVDIIAANVTSANVSILLGTTGSFAPPVTYASGGSGPNFTVLADINGDSRPDIVTGNENDGTLGVLTGVASAPGTFAPVATYPTGGTGPISLALADLNNDGRRDVVVANHNSGTVATLLNTYLILASSAAQADATTALYPNPAQGAFTVLLPAIAGATTVQADLLNPLGQIVRRQQVSLAGNSTHLTFETVGLAAGVYTVRLQAGPTGLVRRVTVQ